MLRRVRDKLYQDGAGLPPQGRTVRCPSLSPPARGTPLIVIGPVQRTSSAFPASLCLLGDDPQTPDAGFARKTDGGPLFTFASAGGRPGVLVRGGGRKSYWGSAFRGRVFWCGGVALGVGVKGL